MSKISVFFALTTFPSENSVNCLAHTDFIRTVLFRGWRVIIHVQLAELDVLMKESSLDWRTIKAISNIVHSSSCLKELVVFGVVVLRD